MHDFWNDRNYFVKHCHTFFGGENLARRDKQVRLPWGEPVSLRAQAQKKKFFSEDL
jgi:hypothetical protein